MTAFTDGARPLEKEKNIWDFEQVQQVDPQILKESANFEAEQFLNSIPVINKWIENCPDCRIPMSMVYVRPEDVGMGILESVRGIVFEDPKQWPKFYKEWMHNPVVNSGSEFWYCEGCQSVWSIVSTFWTKVLVRGEEKVPPSSISRTVAPVVVPEVYDPGIKESEDSTMCPNCKVWRTVEPYSGTIRAGETYVQHVCPRCKAVDIVRVERSPSQEKEITECRTTTEQQ